MMIKIKRSVLVLALAFSSACAYQRPADEAPERLRLSTEPTGAKVWFTRLGQTGYTNCELPKGIRKSDVILIRKEGYQDWKKQLAEAWQEAEGTYKVELKPLAGNRTDG